MKTIPMLVQHILYNITSKKVSCFVQISAKYFTPIQNIFPFHKKITNGTIYTDLRKREEKAVSEYVLELKGITKIFPGVKALNNVQFQLKPGEVHATVLQ